MDDQTTNPLRICDHLAAPEQIPLKRLIELTRNYYDMSARSVDLPRSQSHAWYYRLANECERRGLDLDRVLQCYMERRNERQLSNKELKK